MTPDKPFFKIINDKPDSINWDDYAYSISSSFNLRLKWSIARNLLELTLLHRKPSDCRTFEKLWKDITSDEMITRQQMFALQTISVTMELTENFAAMCYAYAEAIENGSKYFPLLLRDFGSIYSLEKKYKGTEINFSLGNADKLFDAIKNNEVVLIKYLPTHELTAETKKTVILDIMVFRKNYKEWYNKFKHTNSVLPFEFIWGSKTKSVLSQTTSVLHRIPANLKWDDEKVTFEDIDLLKSIKFKNSKLLGKEIPYLNSPSFLMAYQNIDDVAKVLEDLQQFWHPIHTFQHNSLFSKYLPQYKK